MSEPRDAPGEEIAAPSDSGTAPPSPTGAPAWRSLAIGLAGALLLVAALVASAPFWVSALPWAPLPAQGEPLPDPRLDRLEAAQQQNQRQRQEELAAANAALQRLDQRVGALESRPAGSTEIADLPRQTAKLSDDVADLRKRVEKAEYAEERRAGDVGDLATSLRDLDRNLAARLDAMDKAAHAQAAADARTDTAIALVLLQIRGAVAAGRPFAAEYDALVGLARARPGIAAAAAPLAEPAKTGVAGRAVLASRLRELKGAILTAAAPANAPENASEVGPDWIHQVLHRLSGLVQVWRVGEVGQGRPEGGPEAAVNAAQQALAGGDLDSAVAAVDKLTGPPAEAAAPWLRMAKQRLAVDAALHRLEALLAARLGAAANPDPPAGSPR